MSTNGPVPGTGPYGQHQPVPPPPPTAPPHQQQVPGPQPGYGHPQQVPVPQQGYGNPQQGHGYQQPMAPQHGYGYPQQFSAAPTPPVPPPKKKTCLVVLLVFALLVLGGAGGAAWYVLAGSPSEPLWSVPTNASGASLGTQEVDGTWFTDKAVIQTWSSGVKAYDRDTGKKLWATPLPGSGNVACVAPSQSFGDIGVVAYGPSDVGVKHTCDHVAAYDLKSGEELWHRGFKAKDEFGLGNDISVARAGEVVVVRTDQEHKALTASDGSMAWDPRKSATWDKWQSATGGCNAGSYTGGENLIRLRVCSEGDDADDKDWSEVSLIDPATGKAEWTKRMGEGDAKMVVSSSPLVLSGDPKGTYSLDEKTGKERGTFPGKADKYLLGVEDNGSPMRQAAGFGNVFLMGGYDPEGGKGSPMSMAAFDLDSGKQLWKTKASPQIKYMPLRETGGERLLVYVTESTKNPKLVEFGAKDGAMKTVVEYPEEVDKNMGVDAWPHWSEGRIYVSCIGGSFDESYALVALPTTGS